MPLANIAGFVAGSAKITGQGGNGRGKRDPVAVATSSGSIKTGLNTRAGWTANRLTTERVPGMRAFRRETIEIRGEIERVSVDTTSIPSLLIGKKDKYVGRATHRGSDS